MAGCCGWVGQREGGRKERKSVLMAVRPHDSVYDEGEEEDCYLLHSLS